VPADGVLKCCLGDVPAAGCKSVADALRPILVRDRRNLRL
jgi:hypothetical protein